LAHWEKIKTCRITLFSSTKTRKADFGQRCQPYQAVILRGETVDELKHNIREAIAGVLEVLREQGGEPDSNIQILDVAV